MAGKFPEANRHKPRTKNHPADIDKGLPPDPAGNREQRRAAARLAKGKALRAPVQTQATSAKSVREPDVKAAADEDPATPAKKGAETAAKPGAKTSAKRVAATPAKTRAKPAAKTAAKPAAKPAAKTGAKGGVKEASARKGARKSS